MCSATARNQYDPRKRRIWQLSGAFPPDPEGVHDQIHVFDAEMARSVCGLSAVSTVDSIDQLPDPGQVREGEQSGCYVCTQITRGRLEASARLARSEEQRVLNASRRLDEDKPAVSESVSKPRKARETSSPRKSQVW